MKKATLIGIVLGIVLSATASHAQRSNYQSFMKDLVESNIQQWLQDPQVIESIKAQNAKHANLSQDEILRLDEQWRAERKEKEQPLINAVLGKPLSTFLQEVKEQNEGLFSEIFVMDNKGLNVGQSDSTSDYWQGDEDKWQKTYAAGPEGMLIGNREFDESANKFLIQVSVSIVDPANQEAIGAATIGVNLVQLMRGVVTASMQ